jgi:hypothetical protein
MTLRLTQSYIDGLDWHEMSSSNVEAVARAGGSTYVKFKGGGIYRYEDSPKFYSALVEANDDPEQSVGKTLNAHKATFSYERVQPAEGGVNGGSDDR